MEMEEVFALIDQFGLAPVIIGFLSCLVCGMLKTPIIRYIRGLKLDAKLEKDYIARANTIIVCVLSAVGVSLYYCIPAKSASSMLTLGMYLRIASAIACAKLVYALYEGVGPVSIKKLIHALFTKTALNKKQTGDIVDKVQSILIEQLGLPMTNSQKEKLAKALNGKKIEEKETDEEKNV